MRTNSLITLLFLLSATVFGALLENSNIQVEINGDGKVGALAYKVDMINNNVNDASMRLKMGGSTIETIRIADTEKTYPSSQLFIGYGAGIFSNIYIFTVANIPNENNVVNELCAVTGRENANLGVAHYVDADIYGTIANDWAEPYNSANHTVTTQETSDRYVGFTGRVASLAPTSFMIDDVEKVAVQVLSSVLPNTIKTNESPNLASALAYPQANLNENSVRVTSKLMIGNSNTEIQQFTNTDDAPVYFKGYGEISAAKVKFSQKFKKPDKDQLQIGFFVNMQDHASVMSNLADFDVAFYVGHSLFFIPGDGTETKVKKRDRLHKVVNTSTQKLKKLQMKSRKDGLLKVVLTVKNDSIAGATGLSFSSSTGKGRQMYLPFTMAMIGTSSTDTAKRGKVWLTSGSFPVTVDVKQGKNAKGKMKK